MEVKTYGDYLNILIKVGIITLGKCEYCGRENYLRYRDESYYCHRCGNYNEIFESNEPTKS
jgi:hypothetical protein